MSTRTPTLIDVPRCQRCGSRTGSATIPAHQIEATKWEWRVRVGTWERRYAIEANARKFAASAGGRLDRRPVGEWTEVEQ